MTGLDDLLGNVLGGKKGGGRLDDVLSGLAKGRGSGGTSGGGASAFRALLPLAAGLLAGGGLSKLLSGFKAQGLSREADSWVGTEANEPVSGAAMRHALGDEQIAEIADKLGVTHDQAAEALAEVVPQLVDHVTPEGQIPAGPEIDRSLGELRDRVAAVQ
jgi:uncharacterized protein YidB (DUF937 family)